MVSLSLSHNADNICNAVTSLREQDRLTRMSRTNRNGPRSDVETLNECLSLFVAPPALGWQPNAADQETRLAGVLELFYAIRDLMDTNTAGAAGYAFRGPYQDRINALKSIRLRSQAFEQAFIARS